MGRVRASILSLLHLSGFSPLAISHSFYINTFRKGLVQLHLVGSEKNKNIGRKVTEQTQTFLMSLAEVALKERCVVGL